MKLGILVNTDRHAEDVVGLTKAAITKGHEILMFMMDTGIKLLGNSFVTDLCNEIGVHMSFCNHSTEKLGVSKEGCPDKIVCGSQFDNAIMNHEADRVIVL